MSSEDLDLVVVPRRALVVADQAKFQLTILAVLHGILSFFFGGALVLSALAGRDVDDSYAILTSLPFWPVSMGLAFMAIGAVQFYSRFRVDYFRLSAIAFYFQSALSLFYAVAFFVGSLNSNVLWGPQWLYLAVSAFALVHARYAWWAYRAGE